MHHAVVVQEGDGRDERHEQIARLGLRVHRLPRRTPSRPFQLKAGVYSWWLVKEGLGTDTNLGDNTLKQLASLSIRRHATALRSAGAAF